MTKTETSALKERSLKPKNTRSKNEASLDSLLKEKALFCAKAILDKKGMNTKILKVASHSDLADYFVLSSAMNDKQLQAISNSLEEEMRLKFGSKALSVEGYQEARWILLDFGDILVHLFLEPLRDYYDLDTLWAHAEKVQIPTEYYSS